MKTSWTKSAPVLALNTFVLWPLYIALCAVLWAVGVPLIWWAARKYKTVSEISKVWPHRLITRWYWDWVNPVWGNEQDGVDGIPLMPIADVERQRWWTTRWERTGPDGDGGWIHRDDRARAAFQWSARRNSTNNLRFMHYFVPWLGWLNPNTIEPSRIQWSGTAVPLEAVLEKTQVSRHTRWSGGEKWEVVEEGGYLRRLACLLVRQGPYAGIRIAVRFRGRAHQLWIGWKLNTGMAVPGWWPEDPCWKGVGFTCGQVRHLP